MTFDPHKIDLVALSPDGSQVELHIVRESPWTGSDEELNSFQSKAQTYVSYALDGQMLADYPETNGLPWTIVVTSYVGGPDERSRYVLETLQERLPAYGGTISLRVADV